MLVDRNPRRVYAWLEDGTLPGRKIKGGIWVADTEDLDKIPGLAPITEPEIAIVRSRLSPSLDAELPELPASIELARLRRQVQELQEQLGRAEWEREQWRSYAHTLHKGRDAERARAVRAESLQETQRHRPEDPGGVVRRVCRLLRRAA